MEPFSTAAATAVLERSAEGVVLQEGLSLYQLEQIYRPPEGLGHLGDFHVTEETVTNLNNILDGNSSYRKLEEFRELARTNPEAIMPYFNDIHTKGQAGEAIFEANLQRFGEVRTQEVVQLEGAATGNKIDLQLVESTDNIKQLELTMDNGQVIADGNYDILKGDSASFEVKNGGLDYLRQEVRNGELLQQIEAGKQLSDHSYVVINEDTAAKLMENPTIAENIIRQINEAGGKLIVGLPEEAVQTSIFLG
ncbi:hypothetical protein ACQCT3_02235 [Sutcliffiella horikoshii]|uniref:hypothetical protein n=1 Tax=Sutcliffiella horikoshii TaxID=79883 RepID=UPI003CED0D57